MTPEQKQRIIISQRDALRRNGFHPNALFWSDKTVQELRFDILLQCGLRSADSVLDVGCGFGDLGAYLQQKNRQVAYTGIDISPELLAEGKRQYPDLTLIEADLLDFNPKPQSFDFVLLSGVLNRHFMGNNGAESARDYAFTVISTMFKTCRKGIAFNLLDARHEWTAKRWDLQSFHPDEITHFISKLTDNYQLIDDYLENDFTLYVWR